MKIATTVLFINLLFAVAPLQSLPAGQFEVISHWSIDSLATEVIVVNKETFSKTGMIDLCSQLCSTMSRTSYLWTAYIFSSSEDANDAFHRPAIDAGLESWRGLYSYYAPKRPPIAEMLTLGNNTVVRLRMASGEISAYVLRGHDILRVKFGDDTFNVLDILISKTLSASISSPREIGHIQVFIQGNTLPSKREGRILTEEIWRRMRKKSLTTIFSKNSFFVFHSEFWPIYPFANLAIPTAADFVPGSTLDCHINASKFSCSGTKY